MTAAAFQATYSDWKLIKTRSTVQIVFEVPVEQAKLAYEVLGGMPTPAAEVWCGIARLQEPLAKEVIEKPRPKHAASTTHTGGAHRSWHEMAASQQAGLLCNEDSFVQFLIARHKGLFNATSGPANHYDRAAQVVRSICEVGSRSLIDKQDHALARWRQLATDYRAWMREPEIV